MIFACWENEPMIRCLLASAFPFASPSPPPPQPPQSPFPAPRKNNSSCVGIYIHSSLKNHCQHRARPSLRRPAASCWCLHLPQPPPLVSWAQSPGPISFPVLMADDDCADPAHPTYSPCKTGFGTLEKLLGSQLGLVLTFP